MNILSYLKEKFNHTPKPPAEVINNTVYVLFGIPKEKEHPIQNSSNSIIVQIFADYNDAFNALEKAEGSSKSVLHRWSISRMKVD